MFTSYWLLWTERESQENDSIYTRGFPPHNLTNNQGDTGGCQHDFPQTQNYLPQIYKARVPSSLFHTEGMCLINSCIGRAAKKGVGGGYLLASELGETPESQSRKPFCDTPVSSLKIPRDSSQTVSFTFPLFLNYNKEELTRTVCTARAHNTESIQRQSNKMHEAQAT